MPKKPPAAPAWLDRLRDYYWLHDVMRIYTGLPFWVVLWDGREGMEWMDLSPVSPLLQPYHFEVHFGLEQDRGRYYRQNMRQALKSGRLRVGQRLGFFDFFHPLGPHGKGGAAVLYAGAFRRGPVELDALKEGWRKMAGREASSLDPDFVNYVRMALSLPEMGGPVMGGMREFFSLYAAFLTGGAGRAGLFGRLDRLRRRVFARHLAHPVWMQQAVEADKFRPVPWQWNPRKELEPWMKDELGIQRLPTAALALMPLEARGGPRDAVESLLLRARIQAECLAFARDLPQTVADRLQDYGVFFLTSPEPGAGPSRARLDLLDKAEQARRFVRRRFGLDSAVGIGSALPPGERLHPSFQEAVLALHFCVQQEKPVLFYDETPPTARGYTALHDSGRGLLDAFERGSEEASRLASDRWVRQVLIFANQRGEVARSQFLAMLFQLLDRLRRRCLLSGQAWEDFSAGLYRRLEEAASVYQLIEAFKDVQARLLAMGSRPLEGPKAVRLQATLRFLEENFQEPLTLAQVARHAGFSVPVFCRAFRQATGTALVPHLQKLRVERAKFLLRTSPHTVQRVGALCGFRSTHHFIRTFRRLAGGTPKAYRQGTRG